MKAVGICCLLAATVWLTQSLEAKETRRVREAEAVTGLLRWMRAQISCFSLPLAEIYAGYRNELWEKNGVLPLLRQRGLGAVLGRLSSAFSEEELRPLVSYAAAVGTRFSEEEVRAIDAILPFYGKIEEDRRGEAPRRKKLARSLCATGGMMVVLLVL